MIFRRQTNRQRDRITSLLSGGVLTNSKTCCLFGDDDMLKEINAVWTPSSLGSTINQAARLGVCEVINNPQYIILIHTLRTAKAR